MGEALRELSAAYGGVIIGAFALLATAAGVLKIVDAINGLKRKEPRND